MFVRLNNINEKIKINSEFIEGNVVSTKFFTLVLEDVTIGFKKKITQPQVAGRVGVEMNMMEPNILQTKQLAKR